MVGPQKGVTGRKGEEVQECCCGGQLMMIDGCDRDASVRPKSKPITAAMIATKAASAAILRGVSQNPGV
jgi:hypothetical protein